jgi:hypothetical protein
MDCLNVYEKKDEMSMMFKDLYCKGYEPPPPPPPVIIVPDPIKKPKSNNNNKTDGTKIKSNNTSKAIKPKVTTDDGTTAFVGIIIGASIGGLIVIAFCIWIWIKTFKCLK